MLNDRRIRINTSDQWIRGVQKTYRSGFGSGSARLQFSVCSLFKIGLQKTFKALKKKYLGGLCYCESAFPLQNKLFRPKSFSIRDLMPIRTQNRPSLLMPYQIWIRIRILPYFLHKLENLIYISFILNMFIYLFSVTGLKICNIVDYLTFFGEKLNMALHLVETGLGSESGLRGSGCRSDRIRIHRTVLGFNYLNHL